MAVEYGVIRAPRKNLPLSGGHADALHNAAFHDQPATLQGGWCMKRVETYHANLCSLLFNHGVGALGTAMGVCE